MLRVVHFCSIVILQGHCDGSSIPVKKNDVGHVELGKVKGMVGWPVPGG